MSGRRRVNLFRYCDDDPVDKSDPMGLDDKNYVPPWDLDTWNGVETHTISEKKITVAAHGLVTQMANRTTTERYWNAIKAGRIFGLPSSMQLSPKQLVSDVKALKKYSPTIPIQLNVCHAGDIQGARAYGKDVLAQAQYVANEFGTNPVIANSGDVNPFDNTGRGDWYRFTKDNDPVKIAKDSQGAPSDPSLGAGGSRVFDSYGSTTAAAAAWEASWGSGGWFARGK